MRRFWKTGLLALALFASQTAVTTHTVSHSLAAIHVSQSKQKNLPDEPTGNHEGCDVCRYQIVFGLDLFDGAGDFEYVLQIESAQDLVLNDWIPLLLVTPYESRGPPVA